MVFTIVLITQVTIIFSVIITLLTFSIGFGFKEFIIKKLLNIQGQIIIYNNSKRGFLKKKIPILLNQFSNKNCSIRQIHPFSEKNVMIVTNQKNVEKFVFKGFYEKDYNTAFFKYFLVKGSFSKIKKNLFSSQKVILSQKISCSLGLNIGSIIHLNFLSFKKGIPFFTSKKFYVCGLYDTGIPEFDNVYMIGDMKHIQHINNWNENFLEGIELFLSSIIDHKKMELLENKIKKKIPNNFLVKTIYDQFDSDNILEWIHIFNVNILVISFIVLISIIINMVVFLLILILERMKTIGILKIIGAKNKVIYKIFLYYVMKILIPSLIIGNIIGISFLILQKKFRFLSLNKVQYYIDFVPVYLNINDIVLINLSIIFICISTMFFTVFFIINKITLIRVIEFE
ncbi:ABC transporter permease [Blattabacterium cuenoti]|uniref:ABC transporter permease n=1 Tax=Blattabacterium cuenoti TaxID=1653831 RepID=UPI00163C4524|nr:FtsX-like permease family protein [Blattabacterium cuenoti]